MEESNRNKLHLIGIQNGYIYFRENFRNSKTVKLSKKRLILEHPQEHIQGIFYLMSTHFPVLNTKNINEEAFYDMWTFLSESTFVYAKYDRSIRVNVTMTNQPRFYEIKGIQIYDEFI